MSRRRDGAAPAAPEGTGRGVLDLSLIPPEALRTLDKLIERLAARNRDREGAEDRLPN